MTAEEFERLSTELRELARVIPLRWGNIQNDKYDELVQMFHIDSYRGLEEALAPYDDKVKNYFRRRWYLWQCSRCDEYLFAVNDAATANPNEQDQSYDVEFNGKLKFDIKGTVIPRNMRGDIDSLLVNPQPMVDFYYNNQSQGVRNSFQNRLFVVHHSFVDQAREFYLRCAWGSKKKIYAEYSQKVGRRTNFWSYQNCTADVIFILERERSEVEYLIF